MVLIDGMVMRPLREAIVQHVASWGDRFPHMHITGAIAGFVKLGVYFDRWDRLQQRKPAATSR
jgi:hypothetical protein